MELNLKLDKLVEKVSNYARSVRQRTLLEVENPIEGMLALLAKIYCMFGFIVTKEE